MNLKKLIADLPLKWISRPRDVSISGITAHSKSVAPGNLFIAREGASPAGIAYIDEALSGGASAIISSEWTPLVPEQIVQLRAESIEEIEVLLADRFYPSHDLQLCGITGTNGKTTISFLIKHLLESFGVRTGVIGTIAYLIGELQIDATLTTPDVITIRRLLSEMTRCHCLHAVMETSSHGLKQGRTRGLTFDRAIFTNLTQDHLDYHGTMDEYAAAKRILFQGLGEKAVAIINENSPYSALMVEGCKAKRLSYGYTADADLFARSINLSPKESQFEVCYQNEVASVVVPLVGRFNVLNTLAAIGYLLSYGYPLAEIAKRCRSFGGVPGRLESIENPLGLNLYVDFAHTPDALDQVCQTLRECTTGKLIVVFGAGGDRDPSKRGEMGKVVDRLADYAILTSDNARSEDPKKICEQIGQGFKTTHYHIEIDRRLAIGKALEMAKAGDTILVAGKGHESFQVVQHKTIPFDDRNVLRELVQEVKCV